MRWKKFPTGVNSKKIVDGILHEFDEIKANKKKDKPFKSFADLAEDYGLTEQDISNIEKAKKEAGSLEGGDFLLSANTYTFENGDICRNYSRVGVLMVEAIEEAYQQLDCPVHITGEYLCGKNWADCH